MHRSLLSHVLPGLAILVLAFAPAPAAAQNTMVAVTATVQEAPPRITLNWPASTGAPFYRVWRKAAPQDPWQPLAELPGTATSYADNAVAVGDRWEYAVVRSNAFPIIDTVCLQAGTQVTFHITDGQSDGLCCIYSQGGWKITMCGESVASGGEFGATDQATFTVCGSGPGCTDVIIAVEPDHYPGDITWWLQDAAGDVLEQGSAYADPAFGYVEAGIRVPPVHHHGTALLLVEAALAGPLATELERLRLDLIKDGWDVLRSDVPAGTTVPAMKQLVVQAASADPELAAALLIGDLPVAYSGKIGPDGHPDHYGAWPADVYYGELDGPWTDEVTTATDGSLNIRTINVPGDGKFDQSTLPSDVDLMVGRIDLSDLPVFLQPTTELLRSYLDRDHAWRSDAQSVPRRALVDYNFPGNDYDAPFRRGCTAMFGTNGIEEGSYFTDLEAGSYMWALGAGPGSYISALNVGTSTDFAFTSVQAVFSHLFGSYFGDWDSPNNFLRSGLASGSMLGTVWGRQHMLFHPMATGRPIGEAVLRSQNATFGEYLLQGRLVETALMGDPTITMYPVEPVSDLVTDSTLQGVGLMWQPPSDPAILGYHVYRASSGEDYQLLNEEPVATPNYFDEGPPSGELVYMVRTLKLESSASGTFQMLSAGVLDTLHYTNTVGLAEHASRLLNVYPSPTSGHFTVDLPPGERVTGLELRDARGRIVAAPFTVANGRVDVSAASQAGVYTLLLSTDRQRYVERVVVQ